jgi:hypothetical protein
MAENIVVKEVLTDGMIAAGEELVKGLDVRGWPVEDALWFYDSDNNRWQLMIASPKVDTDGPQQSYSFIRGALDNLPNASSAMNLFDVTVRSPTDRLIEVIGKQLNTGPGIHRRRFRGAVGGQYIDDALLYRST